MINEEFIKQRGSARKKVKGTQLYYHYRNHYYSTVESK